MSNEPSWLTAKVDQRLALMEDHIPMESVGDALIVSMLTEPPPNATPEQMEVWERSCDNCGKHCPGDFYTGHVSRTLHGKPVRITFGVCPSCKDLS